MENRERLGSRLGFINVQANRLASDPDLTDEELITLTTDDVLTMLEGK